MGKYIDADKLIAEIERREKIHFNDYHVKGNGNPADYGACNALCQLRSFVASLQQEQPDCHTVEDWILHIQNADQLTNDIFSKGPYDVLYDALNHPYQHCYDAIKEFGELCFQTGVNSVKQEQPEVDLEKYIENEINHYGLSLYEASYGTFSASQIDRIIRNAFELGLNARKED